MASQPTPKLVQVISPDGQWGTLPSDDVANAVQNGGFRIPSPKEVQDYQTEQANDAKYGEGVGNSLEAGALGFARGLSVNLSDPVLTHLGMSPETIKELQERHPIASTTGQIAGVGTGIYLTGGASAAAKGAAGVAAEGAAAVGAAAEGAETASALSNIARYNPAGQVARLGRAVSEGVAPAAQSAADLLANPNTSPIVNKILAGAAQTAIGSSVEGAFYGAGQTLTDHALGDPNVNGEKLMANMGYGALFGGALGGLIKTTEIGVPAAISKGRASLSDFLSGKASAADVAAADAGSAGTVAADASGAGTSATLDPVEAQALNNEAPVLDTQPGKQAPTSFEDMQAHVKDSTYKGETTELPQKSALQDAASRIPLENPVHQIQLESLDNAGARDRYKALLETQGPEADAARKYEALQKRELVQKADEAINALSPDAKPTSNAIEGGNKAIQAFTDSYKKEQEELTPFFNKFNEAGIDPNADYVKDFGSRVKEAFPGMERAIEEIKPEVAEGEIPKTTIKLKPYKSIYGVQKSTYNAIRGVLDSLEEGPRNFKDLATIRDAIDSYVDVMEQGKGPAEIRNLKRIAMDMLQENLEKKFPEDDMIRNVFRRWAINENERTVIEKVFGASVGTKEFGAISKIKPEDVLDRIFANSATVKAARSILEPKEFNELLANFLAQHKAEVTDNGAFSANKFNSKLLQKYQAGLQEAFKDNRPEVLQRLHDATTIMRILPDSTSINPSGTAKTVSLIQAMSKVGGVIHGDIVGTLKETGSAIQEAYEHKQAVRDLNQVLAGKAEQVKNLSNIERTLNSVSNAVVTGAKKIFYGGLDSLQKTKGALLPSASYDDKQEAFKKIKKHLDSLDTAENVMDGIDEATKPLYASAPNIQAGAAAAAARATTFLKSKLPQTQAAGPLSPEIKPSDAELAKFFRYQAVVENPVHTTYSQIAKGTLNPQTIETLQAVYPSLYGEMKVKILDQMAEAHSKGQSIPYKTKTMLSMFLGQDLTSGLANLGQGLPQAPAQNQAQGMGKPTLGGMKQINIADRMPTEMQAIGQREKA
jgi:hypothetical protein